MANAYSTPERTAAHLQKLDDNHDEIVRLRRVLADPEVDMADYVLAFTRLYELHDGDSNQQRRLMVNLEFAAKRRKEWMSHERH